MKMIGRYLGTGPCLRKRGLSTVAMDLADAAQSTGPQRLQDQSKMRAHKKRQETVDPNWILGPRINRLRPFVSNP